MRRGDDDSHGCGPRETAILSRTDAGDCPDRVAADLFVKPSYVRQVMRCYSGSWRENDRMAERTRRSCAEYGERLALAGGCYL